VEIRGGGVTVGPLQFTMQVAIRYRKSTHKASNTLRKWLSNNSLADQSKLAPTLLYSLAEPTLSPNREVARE
jgi:hypothetical protein